MSQLVYVRAYCTPELIELAKKHDSTPKAAFNVPESHWHHIRLRLNDMSLLVSFYEVQHETIYVPAHIMLALFELPTHAERLELIKIFGVTKEGSLPY